MLFFKIHNTVIARLAAAFALFAAVVSGSCQRSRFASTTSEASLTAAEFRTVHIGLCEDYPPESTSVDMIHRDMQLLRSLGVKHLRVSFGWDDLEPEDDAFDWAFTDAFVRIAVDEYGMTLLPYVCYTPDWIVSEGGEDFWRMPPDDVGEFAEFVHELVNRYEDRIQTWELWNEPDNREYWLGTREDYAALLKAGASAVRTADPDAKVVFGGIAHDLSFLRELFEDHHAGDAVDIINLHSYAETWLDQPLESITGYLNEAAAIAREFGDSEPLWMAEIGYSSFRQGAYVSHFYQAVYKHEHTEAFQAAALLRMLTLTLTSPHVELIAWYEINDLHGEEEVIGDANNRHLGIVNVQGQPKPSAHALRLAKQVFSQPLRCVDDALVVQRNADSHSQVHAFQRRDGTFVVVAWLKTITPERPQNADGEAVDVRMEQVTIELPATELQLMDAVSATGQAISTGQINITSTPTQTRVDCLDLRGDEVMVLELAPIR